MTGWLRKSSVTLRAGAMESNNDEYQRHVAQILLYKFARRLLQVVFSLCFSVRCTGRRNVPATGGVLLASNHQSFLDPILVGFGLHREVHYMARETLFRNPLAGWLIRALYAFPVKRHSADLPAIKKTLRFLKNGEVVNLFTEGTRTRDGKIGKMQPGIVMLARKAGVPVVPVVIDGAFEAWPRDHKLCHCYPIRVMYGRPISPEQIRVEGDDRAALSLWRQQIQMQQELRNRYGRKLFVYEN